MLTFPYSRILALPCLALPCLALLLLLQQFFLARNVAAIAFGGHVLAQGGDGFAGDHLAADGDGYRLRRTA